MSIHNNSTFVSVAVALVFVQVFLVVKFTQFVLLNSISIAQEYACVRIGLA